MKKRNFWIYIGTAQGAEWIQDSSVTVTLPENPSDNGGINIHQPTHIPVRTAGQERGSLAVRRPNMETYGKSAEGTDSTLY
jgi:hypothetical protein